MLRGLIRLQMTKWSEVFDNAFANPFANPV